ncbi:MAG: YdeI/OmpD-associated family protein [Acidimicrobiales bacterium]
MQFRGQVVLGGKTATGIEVPASVVEALGSAKQPAVVVGVGGHSYRTTVAVRGDQYWVPLSAENRTAAGVVAGDDVDVDIALDAAPRTVVVPPDLTKALDADATVRVAFDRLAYSHRKEWVRSVEDAKKPETRQRRIAKAVDALRPERP